MIHSDRASPAAPPRAGAKPPGRPPADGAKKGHSTPPAHGKDPRGTDDHGHQAPHGKDAPGKGLRPIARPPIPDDAPEAEAPPPARSFTLPQFKMPSRRTLLRAAIILAVLLIATGTTYGLVAMIRHNMELTRLGRIESAIAAALADHARKHHEEGRSFEEISFTDYIRRCLGTTVNSPAYVIAHGLEAATGPALLDEAEGNCLRAKVTEVLTAAKSGDVPSAEELKVMEARVRVFLVYAREHGYHFPADLMTYERPTGAAPLRRGGEPPQ